MYSQREPVMLFGIGATKAGTTWLYRYLSAHPDCYFRSIKELHYFSMMEEKPLKRHIKFLERDAHNLFLKHETAGPPMRERLLKRRQDIIEWLPIFEDRPDNIDAYRAYLTDGLAGRRLVGDVTPAYALLPRDCLARMAQVFQDVRFVYLLRDPVSRLWSHVRMMAQRRAPDDCAAQARMLMAQEIDHIMAGRKDREDYAGTITRLQQAVRPDKYMIMFQEEMFTQAGLNRLCSFLGIANKTADFDKRILEGVPLPLDEDLRARAFAALRPQYEFVAHLFSALPESWRKTMSEIGI